MDQNRCQWCDRPLLEEACLNQFCQLTRKPHILVDDLVYWAVVEIGAKGKLATTDTVVQYLHSPRSYWQPPHARRQTIFGLRRLRRLGFLKFDGVDLAWWPTTKDHP